MGVDMHKLCCKYDDSAEKCIDIEMKKLNMNELTKISGCGACYDRARQKMCNGIVNLISKPILKLFMLGGKGPKIGAQPVPDHPDPSGAEDISVEDENECSGG